MARTWSTYQLAMFAAVADQSAGHLVVEALAGSGKTTSLIESLRHLPDGAQTLLCAFNRSIATELTARVSEARLRNVDAMTLHGLGAKVLAKRWGNPKPDKKTSRRQLETIIPGRYRDHLAAIDGVVSWCKSTLTVSPEGILAVGRNLRETDLFDVPCRPNGKQHVELCARCGRVCADEATRWALEALRAACRKSPEISFDDQVFVPAIWGWRPQQYDVVYVDETQDMSAGQLKLAQLALRPGGRLVLVGDRNQAIYSWRGADSDGMARMAAELGAKVLPLSISYRCPRVVARLARRIVPRFEVPETAPEGTLCRAAVDEAELSWRPGDAVLSRVNAPLVGMALRTLQRDVPARIQGKDIAVGLKAQLQRFDCHSTSELTKAIERWRSAELACLDEDQEEAAARISDQADTLTALCAGLRTTKEVLARLEKLFSDDGPAVVFSSVHRAKGLEWNRVFLLAWTFKPSRSQEDANLWYVAITRTRDTLALVTARDEAVRDDEVVYALTQATRMHSQEIPDAAE